MLHVAVKTFLAKHLSMFEIFGRNTNTFYFSDTSFDCQVAMKAIIFSFLFKTFIITGKTLKKSRQSDKKRFADNIF